MTKVPLAEQIEELEAEWDRRNRDYPLLVAQGELRNAIADMKQERLAAAINMLVWLNEHREVLREYILYATRMGMAQTAAERDPEAEAKNLTPVGDFD